MSLSQYWKFLLLSATILMTGCGGDQSSRSSHPKTRHEYTIAPQTVDQKVSDIFGEDTTTPSDALSSDEKHLIGNWYNKQDYTQLALQLRRDGTFEYRELLILSKFHNVIRYQRYHGTWRLAQVNSQLILTFDHNDTTLPQSQLILSNRYPKLLTPLDITLYPGTDIDTDAVMTIDPSKDTVTPPPRSQTVTTILNRPLAGIAPKYFTMVSPKANSEAFWNSAHLKPKGYNYGHKVYKDGDKQYWEYALKRSKEDPQNYIIVISDESWTDIFGHRKSFTTAIKEPAKVYRWLLYWKDLMKRLGQASNRVIHITAGDPPPYFAGAIRNLYDNNASKVPATIWESRFPEVLELHPSNSFAGLFQTMDYIRKKYAPNVAMGYTLKTWGISGFDVKKPIDGWDSDEGTQTMANYLNSFGVDFDILGFNLNPRDGRKDYDHHDFKSYVNYFGAISRKMHLRHGKAHVWIWKVSSTWNRYQTGFFFSHIDMLADHAQGNAIGMTLGHGNDYAGESGFNDFVRDWLEEYFGSKQISGVSPHATPGPVNWGE